MQRSALLSGRCAPIGSRFAQRNQPLHHTDSHSPCRICREQRFGEVFPNVWRAEYSSRAYLSDPAISWEGFYQGVEGAEVGIEIQAAGNHHCDFRLLFVCERRFIPVCHQQVAGILRFLHVEMDDRSVIQFLRAPHRQRVFGAGKRR